MRKSSMVRPSGLRHGDGLDADELRVEGGVAVLEQEADDFLQIAVEFVERLAPSS